MSDKSAIEWTDATWNPVTGCSVVSRGCRNCYAMHLAGTRLKHHPSRAGLTKKVNGRHVWTGDVRLNDQWMRQPLKWKKPRRIFVCAHGDLFHENVPDAWIDRVFDVMLRCPQHIFQVLTKRPGRMREYVAGRFGELHLPLNFWLGVSVEDQKSADARLPALVNTPAAVRFVSYEPATGRVDLRRYIRDLEWVIAGGESLLNASGDAWPALPDWFRTVRDQCLAAGVPFFFKQWGEYLTHEVDGLPVARIKLGKKRAGRMLDGRTHDAMPDVDSGLRRHDGVRG